MENQDALVKEVQNKDCANLVHCRLGQVLVIWCLACSWECTVSNPQWAVKWPGYYYLQAALAIQAIVLAAIGPSFQRLGELKARQPGCICLK